MPCEPPRELVALDFGAVGDKEHGCDGVDVGVDERLDVLAHLARLSSRVDQHFSRQEQLLRRALGQTWRGPIAAARAGRRASSLSSDGSQGERAKLTAIDEPVAPCQNAAEGALAPPSPLRRPASPLRRFRPRQLSHPEIVSDGLAACTMPFGGQLASPPSPFRRPSVSGIFKGRDVGTTPLSLEVLDKIKSHVERADSAQKHVNLFFLQLWYRWLGLSEPPRFGLLANFVNGHVFEVVCSAVIALNACFVVYVTNMGMRSDLTQDVQADTVAAVAEWFFFWFFTLEVVLRLAVHRLFFFVNQDMGWNLFDFALVLIGIFEVVSTWLNDDGGTGGAAFFLRTLRAVKMLKNLRMIRLLNVVAELRRMMAALLGSVTLLFWSIFLLVFFVFLFSVAIMQGISNNLGADTGVPISEELRGSIMYRFGSVDRAMLSLYAAVTGGDDWSLCYNIIKESGSVNAAMFLFFVTLVQLALMNIVMGIFVENALKLAEPDDHCRVMMRRREKALQADRLRRLLVALDIDENGALSWDEFRQVAQQEKLRAFFSSVGLEIRDVQFFFGMLCDLSENKEVEIDFFVRHCWHMTGVATGVDLQCVSFELRRIRAQILQLQERMEPEHPFVLPAAMSSVDIAHM